MKKLLDVPYIDQSIKYPTGCESVSTVMLLNYLGYDIGVDEFIDNYLEKQSFREVDGVIYGANPREKFAGSPYDPDSFGCYAPVICKALEGMVKEKYEVIDETGSTLPELVSRYIDNGMPVITWACINMREPIVGPEWTLDNGEPFTWISNEHCMLLVGYDDENYIFNDPHENNGVISYEKTLVENRHSAQYMQAVGLKKL